MAAGELRSSAGVVAIVVALAACGGGTALVPAAEGDAERGAQVYGAACEACHGAAGDGTESGPPLVDSVYRASHHADAAFLLAVRRGVPQHHWRFGAMPAQEGVSNADVSDIIAFVRDLQRQAGID